MERRTRYDVYSDILETIKWRGGFSAITRISYGANLPVDRTKTSVAFLVERGLIEGQEYGGTRGYGSTARGGEFLQALKTIKKYVYDEPLEG